MKSIFISSILIVANSCIKDTNLKNQYCIRWAVLRTCFSSYFFLFRLWSAHYKTLNEIFVKRTRIFSSSIDLFICLLYKLGGKKNVSLRLHTNELQIESYSPALHDWWCFYNGKMVWNFVEIDCMFQVNLKRNSNWEFR